MSKRLLSKISLYCHPNDEADYVAPAIYDAEGRLVSSYKNLVVKQSTQNPQGKAALVIPKKFVLGIRDMGIKEYDQTKALDDADVVIAKCYANGRAVDDNVAYIFDVTKLEEYIPAVKIRGNVTTVSGDTTSSSSEPAAETPAAETPATPTYAETSDETYQEGKDYYSKDGDTYTKLVAGTDYTVGDSISGTVYEEVQGA